MSAGGKVLAVGVIGLFGLIALAAVAVEAESGRRRLPPPKRQLPARRVHEWRRSIVDESGTAYIARIYAPTEFPVSPPWIVTGWYDPTRDAETVQVEFASDLPFEDLAFAVQWGDELNPDRSRFRGNADQLWPDDKWNDRVVYRYREGAATGCFLVEVTMGGETIDFYHESERPERPHASQALVADAVVVPNPGVEALNDFRKYWGVLADLRLLYEELDVATLNPEDKKALKTFLDQRTKEASATYLSKNKSLDYFSVRR